MKQLCFGVLCIGVIGLLGIVGGACTASGEAVASGVPETDESVSTDPATHGRYLVGILGCSDCHTPFHLGPNGPEPDMSRFLSGHPGDLEMPPPPVVAEPWQWVGAATNTAFAGPWGVSFATNLTPDVSGLGAWDETIFVEAMRTGKHWGQSRPILPPMPWPAYRTMTDEDLRAVFAYLRTVPPISNDVPEALLAPPPAPAAGL